jgi:diguanylate cyclase (GGDEF)-like protein
VEYLQVLANQIAIFLENADLYTMVATDRLTGLYVHSYIETELDKLVKHSKRYGLSFAFLMFDVDKFKHINDTYGHAAGNLVIQAVAEAIRGVSRESDFLGRYGGDEFEIILPHTEKPGALMYAEKLRKATESLEVQLKEELKVRVTISVGVAVYPGDAQDPAKLHSVADNALYRAKAQGRNRVVAY